MSQQCTYKCSNCKEEFQNTELLTEKVPDNMQFAILGDKEEIPKCPRCGHLEFCGFEVIDVAF